MSIRTLTLNEIKALEAEAYIRYPLGSKFVSLFSDKGLIRTLKPFYPNKDFMEYRAHESGIVYIYEGTCTDDGGCSNPRLYENGKWCESYPPLLNSNQMKSLNSLIDNII